jgi:hypothetical protein
MADSASDWHIVNVIWEWRLQILTPHHPFFAIACMVSKVLSSRDRGPGHIYAFMAEDPQIQGYIEVGVTNNLSGRMKQHKKCYGACIQVYPQGDILDSVEV